MAKLPEFESDAERALRMIEEADPAAAALRHIEQTINPGAAALKKLEEGSLKAILEPRAGRRSAMLDQGASYAPPHNLGRPSEDSEPSIPPGSDLPVEQKISDSRDGTRDDGAFQSDAFDAGAFGTSPFGTGPFGGGPIGSAPIGARPNAGGLTVAGQPPPPNPDLVSGPKLIADRQPVTREEYADDLYSPHQVPSAAYRMHILLQLRGLLASFEDVESYDPKRHHNRPPPPLWIEDENYVRNVGAVLAELRTLNGFLEKEEKSPQPEKAVGLLMTFTKKFVEEYAGQLGKGIGMLTVGALFTLLLHYGVPKELVEAVAAYIKK